MIRSSDLVKKLKILRNEYEGFIDKNLKLDMSRGKPCPEQLDLCMDMYKYDGSRSYFTTRDGKDCRNYGFVDGIPEAKELFAELLDVDSSEVIAGDNSSLNLMHDSI